MIQMIAGAKYEGDGQCLFTVWAPLREKMVLHIFKPSERNIQMTRDKYGYFTVLVEDVYPGTKYYFRPDDIKDLPDPMSFFQEDGVHGSSEVIDHEAFKWTDNEWRGNTFDNLVFYEIHTGTFTEQGT